MTGHRRRRGPCAALTAAILVVLPGAGIARAQQIPPKAGTYSLTLLNGGVGPVGTALSEALTAWDGTEDAVYWNPAAAAPGSGVQGRVLTLSGARLFGDLRQTALGYATHLGDAGLVFQVLYFGLSEIPVRGIVPTPEPIATTSAYDLVGAVTIGLPAIAGGGVGVTVKGIYEKLDVADAAGLALDLGIQAPLPFWGERLKAGFALRNLGSMGTLEQETLSLPRSMAAGVALSEPLPLGDWWFRAGLDYWKPADDWAQVRIGIVAGLDVLRLRAGFRYGEGWNTLSTGLGLALRGWRLDYAYVFDPDVNRRALGNVQRVGISLDLDGN